MERPGPGIRESLPHLTPLVSGRQVSTGQGRYWQTVTPVRAPQPILVNRLWIMFQ